MEASNYNFTMMSVNVRGINDQKKRRNVFRWIKKNKIDICLLQETYSTEQNFNMWRNEWGGTIACSHGTNHARGVMLLIKPGFDVTVKDIHTDNIGRIILADTIIEGTPFKILNIYAPNTEDQQLHFYGHLKNLMRNKLSTQDKIILAGDFNLICNPDLDRKGGVPLEQSNNRKQILKILEDIKDYMEIHDIWRTKNPQSQRFTWRRSNPIVKSRLDYWLTSIAMADSVEDADIIPFYRTDHSAILLKLKSVTSSEKGRGIWRLNNSFLDEEKYVKGIIENREVWQKEFEGITDIRLKWELIKYRIRQYSIKYGKEKAQLLKKTETDLEQKFKDLEREQDSLHDSTKEEEIGTKIADIKAQLEEIANYKTKGLILRSRVKWYEHGERSTKYFLQLESRNKIQRSVNKLQKIDGTVTTDLKEILEMQASFYEHLYSIKQTKSEKETADYLAQINVPNLDDNEKQECEGLVSLEECKAALKTFKKGKSPGNDGITAEFYQKFWSLFGQHMVDCFNASHRVGELTTTQKQAVITLLDKGKDRTLLKNWRPISLLNTDYKIISKAIANRFTKFLPKLIHSNQVGYVKGRNIAENIRTIADILDYLKDNNLPGAIVNIDFEKAFDSVQWTFMTAVLRKLNFGPSFIGWIETFYANITSCIINKGHTSRYFNVQRGVRQGDPLSPYLFIMMVEIMARKIRQDKTIHGINIENRELKLLQYADDTNGLLKDTSSVRNFLNTVHEFGQYSGLSLNKDKTEAMWLGNCRNSPSKPLNITWPNKPLKILGVHMSYDKEACYNLNFEQKIDKAKRIINMWHMRNLTLYGKAQIIKTFIISQFMFISSVIDTPKKAMKDISKIIFNFIWKNKTERIRRTVLVNEVEMGGLKIPDFETMVATARYKWLKRLEMDEHTESPWRLILESYLRNLDIPLNVLLHSNYSVDTLGTKLKSVPRFYLEMLRTWSETGNTTRADKNNCIWYNRNVCINGKSVFYPEFLQAGIWYICDLYNEDGTVVPFNTWVSRGLRKLNLIKWSGLVQKTRKILKHVEKTIDVNERTELSISNKGAINKLTSNIIYKELLCKKLGRNVVVPKISNHLENTTTVEWSRIYTRAHKIPTSTKCKDFQYRFLHDILCNKYWLHKWGIEESPSCTYCKKESENLKHMFWTCEQSQSFWKNVIEWLKTKQGKPTINIESVLLGANCDDVLYHLIVLAKMYLYSKRIHDENYTLIGYKMYLKYTKEIEFQIAKERNRVDMWTEKWNFLDN